MEPPKKTFSFGGCTFTRVGPPLETLSPATPKLNVEVTFEEALKLHLAIGECISNLNQFNRSTTEGKRTALNLLLHLDVNRVTVNRTMTAKPEKQKKARAARASRSSSVKKPNPLTP